VRLGRDQKRKQRESVANRFSRLGRWVELRVTQMWEPPKSLSLKGFRSKSGASSGHQEFLIFQ